jgi:hypothetical protein
MALQVDYIRVTSKELFDILGDISRRVYEKKGGNVEYSLSKQLKELLLGYKFYYVLTVTMQNYRFSVDSASFEFSGETEEDVYRQAVATLKAWRDAYFVESE